MTERKSRLPRNEGLAFLSQEADRDREEEAAEITAPKPRGAAREPEQDSAPVRRKRKETLIPFATRLPLGLPEEIKAHCDQMDELITDFMARAARDTMRRDREKYL